MPVIRWTARAFLDTKTELLPLRLSSSPWTWNGILACVFRVAGQKGRLENYEGQRTLASFLMTMVTREALRLRGRERRSSEVQAAHAQTVDQPTPDEQLAQRECELLLSDIFSAALAQLEEEDRLLLYFRVVQKLTLEQIAMILVQKDMAERLMHKGTIARRVRVATRQLAQIVQLEIRRHRQCSSLEDLIDLALRKPSRCGLAELLRLHCEEAPE